MRSKTFSFAIPEYAPGEEPGTTRVLEERHNDCWLDLVHGTPAYTPDGRLVCAVNDMEADTNRLSVDGCAFTPIGLQVREVLDVTDDDVLCVVQRTPELLPESDLSYLWQANAADHDARSFDVVSIRFDGSWEPLTYTPANGRCRVRQRMRDDRTWHGRCAGADAALHERRDGRRRRCGDAVHGGRADREPCRRTRLRAECAIRTIGGAVAIHGDRAAVRGSGYAYADRLPVLMNHTAARDSNKSSKASRSTGMRSGGPIRVHRRDRRRSRHHRPRAEMGSCDLREHESRDA